MQLLRKEILETVSTVEFTFSLEFKELSISFQLYPNQEQSMMHIWQTGFLDGVLVNFRLAQTSLKKPFLWNHLNLPVSDYCSMKQGQSRGLVALKGMW